MAKHEQPECGQVQAKEAQHGAGRRRDRTQTVMVSQRSETSVGTPLFVHGCADAFLVGKAGGDPVKAKSSRNVERAAPGGADATGRATGDSLQASRRPPPSPERLRGICWDVGGRFPQRHAGNRLIFAATHPRHGYLHWSLEEARVEALKAHLGSGFHGARLVIRDYDVTAIYFDGLNAHTFFDIDVQGLSGSYYARLPEPDRNLLAEIGFWLPDNSFCALARSNTCFFDRDRPSNAFELTALYVGGGFHPLFQLDNVLDAPAFERLSADLACLGRRSLCRVAEVETGFGGRLGHLVYRLSMELAKFDLEAEHLAPAGAPDAQSDILTAVKQQAGDLFGRLSRRHAERPFHLVHCHDWYSVPVGLRARDALGLPFAVTLHSTEHERTGGSLESAISHAIVGWERRAALESSLVIVPHDGVRSTVVDFHGAPPDRVVVIADVFEEGRPAFLDPGQSKRQMGLNPHLPVVLFAAELSHASGADILVDAIPTVCRDTAAHFVIAGEGPLRADLEGRLHGAGVGAQCRFLGDVPADHFEAVLMAADFVVIPARAWQPEGLAELAISFGKPVLTTQQARLRSVEHGRNGLVTHDNPGSIVWGIRELLANPLRGSMMRLLARRRAQHGPSFDTVAVEHALAFTRLLGDGRGPVHA